MSVELVTRLTDGHPVVALRGELDVTGSAGTASGIAALTERGQIVIVDLSTRQFMDCASLGALLSVRALATRAASDMRDWHRSWRAAGIRRQLGRPCLKKACYDFGGPVSNHVMATREIAVTGPDIPVLPRPRLVKEPAR